MTTNEVFRRDTIAVTRPVGAAQNTQPGVLVCGEALIDLVADPSVDALGADGPVTFRAFPGGGPANTAVALARLGVPVLLAARLSGDTFGRILQAHLERSGVDLSLVVAADEPSTLAVVTMSGKGHARYSFYTQGTADWQWSVEEMPIALPSSVAVLHAGSLALALRPGGEGLEEFLARHRRSRVISIDPNVRPEVVPDLDRYVEDLERWMRLADIVKVSTDDLRVVYPHTDSLDVARRWHQSAALVVLTAGAKGATALFAGEVIQVPARPVKVVDTVGAGDSFTAGLLDGLLRVGLTDNLMALSIDDIRSAVMRGCTVAGLTCSSAGADPPNAADVPED